MYVFDERISVDVNQVEKQLSVKNTLTVHLANDILTVQILNVTSKFLFQKKMKTNILVLVHMTVPNMNVTVM